MKNNPAELRPIVAQWGRAEIAAYKAQEVLSYAGNPLLEALPPICSEDNAISGLEYYPPYRADDRALPPHIRYHILQNSLKMFVVLPRHVDLEQRFSRLLRGGYAERNPVERGHWPAMVKKAALVTANSIDAGTRPTIADSGGMAIVGYSGLGKTTTINRITDLYPQVIHHNEYHGQKLTLNQIVWLKLQCPFDGSVRGLCVNFFQTVDQILGTNYEASFARSRGTVDELLPHMTRVAALHCTGVLIVDEVQHLNAASSGGVDKMLNFFVQLVNTINLPVILIGTTGAMRILSGELRQIRRGCSQGDLVWAPMRNDEEWRHFLETIWRYQYTRQEMELDQEISDAIFDECQGITDFAVKVYFLSQIRAIATGLERLTPAIVRSVCADSLRLARPVLDALRTGNIRILSTLSDVQPIDFDASMQRQKVVPKPAGKPELRPIPPPQLNIPDAIADPEKFQSESKPAKRTKHTVQIDNAPANLMEIISQGQKKKINAYDALKVAGVTRSAAEFFHAQETV